MSMKKNFFCNLLFFVLIFFIFSVKSASANITIKLYKNSCTNLTGYCTNGDGCPYCGSDTDSCCSKAAPWTKYAMTCRTSTESDGWGNWVNIVIITGTLKTTNICSVADKWNSSDPRLIRAGLCDCTTGGIYKACCDSSTGNLVNSVRRWVGNAYDADCPDGTTIWAGGANIDLAWADANCNPPCTKGDWYYAGACDQYQTCSTAPGCGCNGTEITTPRTVSVNGTNGACGGGSETMHWNMGVGTAPATTNLIAQGLCADGSQPTVSTNADFTYTWTCAGGAGTCSGATGSSASCKAYWLNCNDLNYWAMYPTVFPSRPWLYYQLHPETTWPTSGSTPFCWGGNQITCGNKVAGTPGTNGVCGSANGKTYNTVNFTDTTNLCTSGTIQWTNGPNGIINNTWTWNCVGTAGTCAANGTTANCSATRDLPPVIEEIKLYKNDGTTLIPPTTINGAGWNHTCENAFNNEKIVKWWVRASDSNPNVTDIASMQLRLTTGANCTGSVVYESAKVAASNGISIFTVDTSTIASSGTAYYACAIAYDQHPPLNSGWMDTNRRFKVWNCNVAVSGRLYDGGASGSCSVGTDYSTLAKNTNFNTLDFTDSPTMNMTRISESEYNGNLTWGKFYTATFNSDIAMQISGSGVKTTDVSDGNRTSCPNSIAFNLNSTILNPYSASPTLRVDFSGVVDQDSWYQAVGGGLLANRIITNRVPVTCTTNCAMSINGTTNTNGTVSGPTINNTGNSDANKGSPNNWWINKALAETNSEYGELLNQFFYKAGVGTTFNGDKKLSEIGNNGVNFVKGDLLVTEDNNVSSGQFLMVIVDGNIIVQSNVKNLEGVFVSKNLNIGGSDTNALTIEGMVKATENVKINRTFINKRTNNTAAAVKFIYRPDFIFSMPGAITKQLTKWQWGN